MSYKSKNVLARVVRKCIDLYGLKTDEFSSSLADSEPDHSISFCYFDNNKTIEFIVCIPRTSFYFFRDQMNYYGFNGLLSDFHVGNSSGIIETTEKNRGILRRFVRENSEAPTLFSSLAPGVTDQFLHARRVCYAAISKNGWKWKGSDMDLPPSWRELTDDQKEFYEKGVVLFHPFLD